MVFELKELPYSFDSLEPFIDEKTMRIHHGKHHQGYVNKLNSALSGFSDLKDKPVNELLKNLSLLPESVRLKVRNAGGGYSNHTLFWPLLKLNGEELFDGKLKDDIVSSFGSFKELGLKFENTAKSIFGSGWAWLVVDSEKKLRVVATPNQDSPLSNGLIPILCLDVWEHAYYLNYQNRRGDYVENFSKNINWKVVQDNYNNALQG